MAGVKRNINEMYSSNQNSYPKQEQHCNGNNNMDQNQNNNIQNIQITNTNDAKKTRLDHSSQIKQEPSRVVHLRNIPQQLTENEIIYLGLSFGNITNVLFLRSKNQAFLEFESISDAPNMLTHFAQSPAQFSGKKIFVQYSNHQELNTDPSNSNNQHAQVSLQEACSLHLASKQGGKNTVLRASILNMIYPVTLDVLQQIFSKFGPVLKIITFTKNDKFQVLIQMRDCQAAQNARMSLNNQNIYNGCCTLQIDLSKLTTLEVRFNNDKSRDYTNLLLPTGQDGLQMAANDQMQFQQGLLGNQPNMFNNNQNGSQHNSQGNSNNNSSQNLSQMNSFSNNQGGNNSMQHHQHHMNGGMNQMGGMNQNQANIGYQNNQQGQFQQQQQGGHLSHNQNNGNNQNGSQQQSMGGNNGNNNNGNAGSPVLLVSNLNEEFCTPESLFTLFGVYGDVLRVKILFNKKDSALINFSNCQQANTALMNLDRCKLWSKQVRVFPSKHSTVQMPKDGQPDSGLTKDFSSSPLHRFKKPGSKNFNNIFPPSQTLHLSNIPPSVQEQEIRDLFGAYGTVRNFKFFQKDRKMALIQMDTVDEAIAGLIAMHNYQMAENMHLRCTFSKATI